jgi:hypothetical protein
MGYFEIIPNWEQCDKCQKRIAITEGTYTKVDELRVFFSCKVCK